MIRDVIDIPYPSYEMTCNSKISCISWSQYHKGMLSSSDYEGTVTIWDAFTGTQTQLFQVNISFHIELFEFDWYLSVFRII